MSRIPLLHFTIYLLFCYDVYLYLPDISDLLGANWNLPTADGLVYFDAAMLSFGGIVMGMMLIKAGGKFNQRLAVLMILMNLIVTPWFILRVLP